MKFTIILAAIGMFCVSIPMLALVMLEKKSAKPEQEKIWQPCKRIGGTICNTPNKCRKRGCQK